MTKQLFIKITCRKCSFNDIYGKSFLNSDSIYLIWDHIIKYKKPTDSKMAEYFGTCRKCKIHKLNKLNQQIYDPTRLFKNLT